MNTIKALFSAFFANLFLAAFAIAQTAATVPATPQAPGLGEVFSRMMPMFVVVFCIFYFLVLRPQQAKLRAQQTLIEGLKRGDQVVTTGGIIGRIAGTEKGYILLEIAANTRIKIETPHILRKYEEKVEVLASDKAKAS